MCGRFSLTATPLDVQACFALGAPPALAPRYNVAPSQPIPIVRRAAAGGRELVLVRWGLIPPFAADRSVGNKLINARAESVATKPSFRRAFRAKRCLVPADGFYEWRRFGSGPKQPYLVRLRSGMPFAFAGLWEEWRSPEGEMVESCAIITTEPNELVRQLHDRMPVMLAPEAFERWLAPDTPAAQLQALLVAPPASDLTMHAVSSLVNQPANDLPECITPVPVSGLLPGL
jgi:putative SOS response-associated peptidase YedK